jgi:hypothetical protein
MGKKLDGDIAQAQVALKRARNMEEKYVTLIQQQVNDGGDPQLIRNLEFTVPTAEMLARMYTKNLPYMDKNHDEVRATPVENIVAAKELLENNRTPLDTVVKLMSKALVQQEKATSSRRLASNAALCVSSSVSVPPLKPGAVAMVVFSLTTNLIPGPQRSKGEKLITGLMLSHILQ